MRFLNLVGYIWEQAYTAWLSSRVPVAAGKELLYSWHDDAPRHNGVPGLLSYGQWYTGDVFSPQVSHLRPRSLGYGAISIDDDLGG